MLEKTFEQDNFNMKRALDVIRIRKRNIIVRVHATNQHDDEWRLPNSNPFTQQRIVLFSA